MRLKDRVRIRLHLIETDFDKLEKVINYHRFAPSSDEESVFSSHSSAKQAQTESTGTYSSSDGDEETRQNRLIKEN